MSDQESVARAALAEITPLATIGPLVERVDEEDGVATLTFAADLSGYPGWHWSVSVAQLPGEEPTVLEAELMPGDGSLLAPDWVPWAERLEEYRAAQAAAAAEAGDDDAGDDDAGADDEDDGDDDEEDDDLGDDPHDGIDFEDDDSAVSAGGDDEEHEAEPESSDDRPEQPDES
ncbi:DUF3027 domain-containing protein [Pseudolysinimonas sp.]